MGASESTIIFGDVLKLVEVGEARSICYILQGRQVNLNVCIPGDKSGRRLLHVAAEKNHPEVVESLLQNGADASLPNAAGETPLAVYLRLHAPHDTSLQVLKILSRDPKGLQAGGSVMHFCARNGLFAAFDILLENGMRPNNCDLAQNTVLHALAACTAGSHHDLTRVVSQLVAAGVAVNAQNKEKETAVHVAIRSGNLLCFKAFMAAGARCDILDASGANAVHFLLRCLDEETSISWLDIASLSGTDLAQCDAKGNSPVFMAVARNWNKFLKKLLELGADAKITKRIDGMCPLHAAVKMGNKTAVTMLVEAKVPVDKQNEFGHTALHLAIYEQKMELAKYLLGAGASVDVPDKNGNNAAHLACQVAGDVQGELLQQVLNHTTMVTLLHRNESGKTPDELAQQMPHAKIFSKAKKLILHAMARTKGEAALVAVTAFLCLGKVDLDRRDSEGRTALHIAVLHSNEKPIQELLMAGSDPSLTDTSGNSPLMLACSSQISPELFRKLAAESAVNAHNLSNDTALSIAAANGKLEFVKILCELGADVGWIDKDCHTPLHRAALSGHPQTEAVCAALIGAGAVVNAKSKEGKTPLMIACSSECSTSVVRFLIGKGADIGATSVDGTVLHACCLCPQDGLAREKAQVVLKADDHLIDRHKSGCTPIVTAAKNGLVSTCELLLDNDADVTDVEEESNKSVLHYLSVCKETDASVGLLQRAAELCNSNVLDYQDECDRTALMCALEAGNFRMGHCLVKSGASPRTATSGAGTTALYIAVLSAPRDDPSCVQFLLSAGADVNFQHYLTLETPLHVAVKRDLPEIVACLVSAGALTNVKDARQKTPWDEAKTDAVRQALQSSSSPSEPATPQRRTSSASGPAPPPPEVLQSTANFFDNVQLRPEQIVCGKLLGTGAFGEVYAAKLEGVDEEVAVKIIRPTPDRRRAVAREIKVNQTIVNRNIVQCYGVIELDQEVWIVTEKMDRSLSAAVHPSTRKLSADGTTMEEDPLDVSRILTWAQRKAIAMQITLGVQFLHSRRVLHRDLKPDNVLLDSNNRAKLCDFGTARIDQPSVRGTLVGTYEYMSPDHHTGEVTPASDVFSLGVLLAELFSGQHPYSTKVTERMQLMLLALSPDWQPTFECRWLPEELVSILNRCMLRNPSSRPSLRELKACLESLPEEVPVDYAAFVTN